MTTGLLAPTIAHRVLRSGAATFVVAVALTAVGPVGSARAAGLGSSYTASASGNLVLTSFTVSPPVVFDELLDPGSALAQASVSSLGESQGYASSTSPGTTFDALGGLVGTATGGQVGEDQVPKNPASVRSLFPTVPEQSKSVGPVVLSSRSQLAGTTASTADGSNTGTALASVDPIAGTLIAQSETIVQNVVVSPLLSLNGVRSSASVERASDGLITLGSSFAVTSITVNGATIAVGKSGLDVNGQQQPFDPATAALKPVLGQLAAQGITVETFPEQRMKSSVRSAGVRITVPLTLPPVGALNKATVTYTFGGSSAALDNGALNGVVSTFTPLTSGTDPLGAGGAPASGAIVPPSGGIAAGGSTPVLAGGDGGSSAASPAPTVLGGFGVPLDASSARFYPVLLLAGAALFGATRIFRPVTGGSA